MSKSCHPTDGGRHLWVTLVHLAKVVFFTCLLSGNITVEIICTYFWILVWKAHVICQEYKSYFAFTRQRMNS